MNNISQTHSIARNQDFKRDYRVVMNSRSWGIAMRAVMDRKFAFGSIRWHNVSDAHELLCERLEIRDAKPELGQLHPAQQWILVVPQLTTEFPRDCVPTGTQGGIVIGLSPTDPSKWSGFVKYREELLPLSEIRVIGSRMPLLLKTSGNTMNGESDIPPESSERFSRQIGVVGAPVQQRIGRSTVTIIGAGGLGSIMATQVAMVGTSRLKIIDPDQLGIENLERTMGVGVADCGKPKIHTMLRQMQVIRPDLTALGMAISATSPEAHHFLRERTDLLLSCVDNEACRLRVAEIANETMTVHMDLGTSIQRGAGGELSMFADIRLCLPGEGCLGCVGGIESIHLQRSLLRNRPAGAIPPRLPQTWNRQRAGSLVTLNMMAAGAAVQLWLDLLMGRIQNSVWLRMEWSPERGLVSELTPVTRSAGCEVCGRSGSNTK